MLYKKKAWYNGIEFDSKDEMSRYVMLCGKESRGEIEGLRRQVRFLLLPRQEKKVIVKLKTKEKVTWKFLEHSIEYTCDFFYKEKGRYIVEDVKSWFTRGADDSYPLRRKLMVHKMQKHNLLGHGEWVFREYIVGDRKRSSKVIDR